MKSEKCHIACRAQSCLTMCLVTVRKISELFLNKKKKFCYYDYRKSENTTYTSTLKLKLLVPLFTKFFNGSK